MRNLAAEFERARALARAACAPQPVLTEADVAKLPPPVQRHVRRCGALGRPRLVLLQWLLDPEMVRKPGQAGLPGVAEQFDRFDIPQRVFSCARRCSACRRPCCTATRARRRR